MDATPRWSLPLLFAGQAQKELFHNEALWRIDALLNGAVESADLAIPPANPEVGACWIIAAGASGDWSGQDGAIACWTEGGWRFIFPQKGLSMLAADRGHAVIFDGAAWTDDGLRADGLYLDGQRVVGQRQAAIDAPAGGATVDAEARATLTEMLAILRAHGLISS